MLVTLDHATAHRTPNAVMRRYPGTATAVWRTEMAAGAAGPEHTVDVEQVVVVVDGRLRATAGGETVFVEPGDAVDLPAGVVRQMTNDGEGLLVTISAAAPGGLARVGRAEAVPCPGPAER